MVYLLGGALVLTAWRFAVAARRQGIVLVIKVMLIAACCGLLAGLLIGVSGRVGMSAIAIANGNSPRFTISGTTSVILTLASFGIALGVVYQGLLRDLLHRHGIVYGILLTLSTWYPLAHAATQQLNAPLHLIALTTISGLLISLIWMPFGVVLEALLRRWQI